MIVCVCKNISDKKIKESLNNNKTFEDMQFELGLCTNCEKCKDCIQSILEDYDNINCGNWS